MPSQLATPRQVSLYTLTLHATTHLSSLTFPTLSITSPSWTWLLLLFLTHVHLQASRSFPSDPKSVGGGWTPSS